jgi:hypothetical protein
MTTTRVYPRPSISTLPTGQNTMANSTSVAIASDQTPLPIVLTAYSVVDELDAVLLDTSISNIPASTAAPLVVVASLAAAVKKIVSVDDIGEYIGVYADPLGACTLLGIMSLGGGELELSIPIATVIGLRNMKNAAISTGSIAINFLG